MQDQILTEIKFQSGIIKEQTQKAAEGFWVDGDKIRFRFGKPELLGGWLPTTTSENLAKVWGTPRALETVRSLEGQQAAVMGTNVGIYSSDLAAFYDITPLTTTTSASSAFSTSIGSTRVVVSVSNHGLTTNTIIGITSASATIGGNVLVNTSATVTAHFQISVIGANSFAIETSTTAAATSAATGGAATIFLYAAAGLQSNEEVGGWGTGVWGGNFGWGTSPGGTYINKLRLWSLDLWGTDVLGVPSGGPLYYWSTSAGISSRMTLVTAAPSVNQIVRVATEARQVLLYGTHDSGGTYDSLLIRWSSQENYNDWTPTLVNTAGDFRLQSRGSQIINVTKVADKSVILTDADMFLQSYIGGQDIFGFIRAGENCGIISQNAAVESGGVLYWMSNNGQFFKYDGRLQALPCTVLRYVFQNILALHKDKICAGTNAQFDEVIWFYPSSDSTDGENDRYVLFNTIENHWSIGTLRRTAWRDRNTFSQPLATGVAGTGIFYHETGYSDAGEPLEASLQSAYFDMQDGDAIMFSNKIVPDFGNIVDGLPFSGNLNLTLQGRKYPGDTVVEKGPYLVTGTSRKISFRLRAREAALRLDSATLDEPWRMGQFRLGLEPDGKR